MNILKMHTPDIAEENFKKLAALFPNAVTETKNENGEVVRAIDADVLRQEISAAVVEGNQERYQFTWPDKKKSVVLANQPIAKTLRLDRSKSVGRDGTQGSIDTENVYIEGDNLDALKLLQETYLGKVKMIYIDPPYNTGNDFVYEDDFSQNADEYIQGSGQLDDQGNRLVQNTESNGRFHTDWLNMLYPRLRIARDLLTDDGVIFISIDDNEQENLKKICDEIFGKENFISHIVVETGEAYGVKVAHKDKTLFKVKDYVLVYCKDFTVDVIRCPLYDKTQKLFDTHFSLYLENGKIVKLLDVLKQNSEVVHWFENYNLKISKENINTMMLINSDFKEYIFGISDRIFKDQELTTKIPKEITENLSEYEAIEYKELLIIKTSKGSLRHLRSLKDTFHYTDDSISEYSPAMVRGDLWKAFVKDMGNVAKEGDVDYKNGKKPVRLIKQLLKWSNYGKEEIILDFFSGSATTAHAVMQLNAEDGGNRKFILVQLPEVTDEKSEARKAGYETICDIGEERIRRAGRKIKDESPLTTADLDVGFRVFKVDSSNMENVYYAPADFEQAQLELLADNIKPDRTPEDLLFQVMLDLGIMLSSEIEETEIDGKKVFSVAGGYLIACFDKDVTEETVKAIAQKQPFYAVFRDSGMASDSVATNFEQIFETYSPKTVRRVL